MKNTRSWKQLLGVLALLLALACLFTGCDAMLGDYYNPQMSLEHPTDLTPPNDPQPNPEGVLSIDDVPAFSGEPYVVIAKNLPAFTKDEKETAVSYETYSKLDALGRCGVAQACIGRDLMPTEDRESISSVKPSGWQSINIGGQYLYNRCHLIGFQLSGENANELNLITGTRYMNVDGMLPFENMIADYVKETGNHVLYRVTPIYKHDELVARGVQMEAWSVEDQGDGICFNVFAYNVQSGVMINYADGTVVELPGDTASPNEEHDYVLNTNTKKFHLPTCASVSSMKEHNRKDVTATREELIAQGYDPCGSCHP